MATSGIQLAVNHIGPHRTVMMPPWPRTRTLKDDQGKMAEDHEKLAAYHATQAKYYRDLLAKSAP